MDSEILQASIDEEAFPISVVAASKELSRHVSPLTPPPPKLAAALSFVAMPRGSTPDSQLLASQPLFSQTISHP